MFLEALALIFLFVWVTHSWARLKGTVEIAIPGRVKRGMLNMHHNTQPAVRLGIAMRCVFADGARDRVFMEDVVPYARRLWLETHDERELSIDTVDYVIAVVAK